MFHSPTDATPQFLWKLEFVCSLMRLWLKKSVTRTLLTSAECLPSSQDSKEKERQYDFSVQVLKDNGYPNNFLRNCCKPVTSSRNIFFDKVSTVGFGVFSHIRGITKPRKRILASHKVKVAQKRFQTLEHIFSKPKDCVPRGATDRLCLFPALQRLRTCIYRTNKFVKPTIQLE